MIVKTRGYSNEQGVGTKKTIPKHVDYIFRDYGKNEVVDKLVYYHNIPTKYQSPKGVTQAFLDNEKYRHQKNAYNKQKGYQQNIIHSVDEIISVHAIDREKILNDLWIMQDFGKELMQKLAPDGLGVVVIHIDKDHIHAHCYRHSFKYKQLENTRADNKAFTGVRKLLERVQIERYPQLETKIVYNELEKGMKRKKKGKAKAQEKAIRYQERTNKILDKDLMTAALLDFHKIAHGHQHFFELIANHNIEVYYKGDKKIGEHKHPIEGKTPAGVWVGKRNLRFGTLKLDKEMIEALKNRNIEQQKKQERAKSVLSKYAQYRAPDESDKDRGLER